MGVLQVQPYFLGLHSARFEQKNAGDDLKAVSDPMLHLLQQNFPLSEEILLFSFDSAALGDVLYREE